MKQFVSFSIALGLTLFLGKGFPQTQKKEVSSQIAPTVQIQTGHNNPIKKVEYSKCGRFIVSNSSEGGIVIIWDVKSGRSLMKLTGRSFLTISPNNLFVCFNSTTDEIEQWDFETLKVKSSFKRNSEATLYYSSITSNGKYLASGSMNFLLVYDLSTGTLIKTFDLRPGSGTKNYDYVHKVGFSPNDSLLTVSTFFGKVLFYSTSDWSIKKAFYNYNIDDSKLEASFSYSPDGKFVTLSHTYEKHITILRVKDFSLFQKINITECDKDWGIGYTDFSNDGKILFVSTKFGPLLMYHLTDWTWGYNTKFEKAGVRNSDAIDFNPLGDFFVTVQSCDLKIYSFRGKLISTYKRNIKDINKLEYNSDKKILCSSSFSDVQLWDMKELKLTYTFKGYGEGELSSNANYLAAYKSNLNNGKWSANIILIDLNTKKTLFKTVFPDYCRNLAFSSDEKYFVYPGSNKSVNIYNIQAGVTNNIQFPEFNLGSSADNFSVSPVKNELILCGMLKEMAFYNFDNKQITYLKDYTSTDWDKEIVYDIKHSQNSDDFAFCFSTGNNQNYCVFKPTTRELRKLAEIPGHYAGLGLSSDGTKLGLPTNPFKIVDSQTGNTLKQITTKQDDVITGLIFTNNDKNLISSSDDGTIRYWDYETGQEIYKLIPSSDGENFIFITPDGYYKSSRLGTSLVHYVLDGKMISFDQLDLKYNRPDILLQRSGCDPNLVEAYHQAYLKRVKKMGFTEKDLESGLNMPEIKVLTEKIPVNTDNKQLIIKVKATDKKHELNRINLYVNDVPIYGSKGISLKSLHVKEFEKDIEINLNIGLNKVQVSATNSAGVESYRENFVTTLNGVLGKPALYILAIGVSEFDNKDYNLTYAAKDAEDFEALNKKYTDQYSDIKTILLTNQNATKQNILAAKQTLMLSKPEDIVILFVASHGLLDNDLNYYIATSDCNFANPAVNGLPYDKLESLLDSIPSRNKLMFIDACHSGEVDKDEVITVSDNTQAGSLGNGVVFRGFKTLSTGKPSKSVGLKNTYDLMNEIFSDIRKGTGAIVISSAGGMEFAFESAEWKNGVFTFSLLEGIKTRKADLNRDGKIVASEIRDYLSRRVKELTSGKQNPTSRTDNLANDFKVW